MGANVVSSLRLRASGPVVRIFRIGNVHWTGSRWLIVVVCHYLYVVLGGTLLTPLDRHASASVGQWEESYS